MRKLVAFIQMTLNSSFAGANGDISWAHGNDDAEFNAFDADNASREGQLLLGRITYELKASYWPTPSVIKNDPIVAEGMNSMPKVVFSRTVDKVSWNNTKLVKGDMAILGRGGIVSQLAREGLIDEYQAVAPPRPPCSGHSLRGGEAGRIVRYWHVSRGRHCRSG